MSTQRECISIRIEDPTLLKRNNIVLPAIMHMGTVLQICKSYNAVLYTGSTSDNIRIFPKKTYTLRFGSELELIVLFKDILDENSKPLIKEGVFILIDDSDIRKNMGDMAFYVNWK